MFLHIPFSQPILFVVKFQAHLALYCFANNQVSSALRLMYRTRYLALLCHGENHPEVGLIDVSLAIFRPLGYETGFSFRFYSVSNLLNIVD